MKPPFLQRWRNAPWKSRLGVALAIWLLLAEAFAVAHEYDTASHTNSQSCAICMSAASFSGGNVAAPLEFAPIVAMAFVAVAAGIVFLSVVPIRRYARGPPSVSFMF